VAAAVELVPGHDVRVIPLGEPPQRPEVEREAGEPSRRGGRLLRMLDVDFVVRDGPPELTEYLQRLAERYRRATSS
jgi:hypothetical protein